MIALDLPPGPLRVVCVGAHPDDIEIGCGATLLALDNVRELDVDYVLLTGSELRLNEARAAARQFLARARVRHHFSALPDGRLPTHWSEVKQGLEDVAVITAKPDVILVPRVDDAHQDHRLVAQLATTVWRDSLILHYEIPKWDGDFGRVTHYVRLDEKTVRRKIELLNYSFSSQLHHDWWDDLTFRGLLRLRGVECHAPYAEGFVITKALLAF